MRNDQQFWDDAATRVLPGILANPQVNATANFSGVATLAGLFADALLIERQQRLKPPSTNDTGPTEPAAIDSTVPAANGG